MPNLVTELDLLRRALDAEAMLHDQAGTDLAQGKTQGPMRNAYDDSVEQCLRAAEALLVAEGR